MGYWKQKMIEEQERGWSSIPNKFVCSKCFEDYALAEFVSKNAVEYKCDYCGRISRKRPIATAIDEVLQEINDGIRFEWNHPDDEGIAYESREGGYQARIYDTWDLIDHLGDPFLEERLSKDIINAFTAQGALWCEKNYYGLSPQDILRLGWNEFTSVVKHSKRYLFSILSGQPDESTADESLRPDQFLSAFGRVINEVDLVRELRSGHAIYRCRVHKPDESFDKAIELGTPGIDSCRFSNRMSPAGIPMFYGAFDENTAIAETFDPSKGSKVTITVARFTTARPFHVLDLTRIPYTPSLFDAEKRAIRPAIQFLHHFVDDLSAPVAKDGREHIDYVPTQVVTEFVRHFYKHPEYGPVRGILYNSARHKGGVCCVLFFESQQCCDIEKGWKAATEEFSDRLPKWWLGLQKSCIKRVGPPDIDASEATTTVPPPVTP